MDTIPDLSIAVIQALQNFSPVLDGLTRFFSAISSPGFYILLVPPVYWALDKKLGKVTLLALLGSAFLGLCLKQLQGQPRPYWLGLVQALDTDATYGAPSTNAMDSLVVLGYLAYRLKKDWLWAAAGLTVVLIGFSRLYLGVQFPLSILSGWLLGLGILFLVIGCERRPLPGWAARLVERQVESALAVSLLMILTGWAIGRLIANTPDPAAWAAFATDGRSLREYFTFAGAFFGTVNGYWLMQARADFQVRGTLRAKAARCLVGFAGMVLIYTSLGWVIELTGVPESLPGYLLRYLQLALLAFWVLFGAPWTFLRLRLAQSSFV